MYKSQKILHTEKTEYISTSESRNNFLAHKLLCGDAFFNILTGV